MKMSGSGKIWMSSEAQEAVVENTGTGKIIVKEKRNYSNLK